MTPEIGEIEIRGQVASTREGSLEEITPELLRSHGFPPDLRPGADVTRELEELWARGVRAVLVHVDSPGGHTIDGWEVDRALRSFSERGGLVVVHIERMAASTASTFALAGDYCVLAPDAFFRVHSAHGRGPRAADLVAAENQRAADLIVARTLAPREMVEGWLRDYVWNGPGPEVLDIGAEAAVHLGFADAILPHREAARAFARLLAAGERIPSTRRERLAARGLPAPGAAPRPAACLSCNSVKTGSLEADRIMLGNTRLDQHWVNGSAFAKATVYRIASGDPQIAHAFNVDSAHVSLVDGVLQLSILFDPSWGYSDYSVAVMPWVRYNGVTCFTKALWMQSDSIRSSRITLRLVDSTNGVAVDPLTLYWAIDVVAIRSPT